MSYMWCVRYASCVLGMVFKVPSCVLGVVCKVGVLCPRCGV